MGAADIVTSIWTLAAAVTLGAVLEWIWNTTHLR
jgi:hypothetical protein